MMATEVSPLATEQRGHVDLSAARTPPGAEPSSSRAGLAGALASCSDAPAELRRRAPRPVQEVR